MLFWLLVGLDICIIGFIVVGVIGPRQSWRLVQSVRSWVWR